MHILRSISVRPQTAYSDKHKTTHSLIQRWFNSPLDCNQLRSHIITNERWWVPAHPGKFSKRHAIEIHFNTPQHYLSKNNDINCQLTRTTQQLIPYPFNQRPAFKRFQHLPNIRSTKIERMLGKCWMNGVFKQFQGHSTFSRTKKMLNRCWLKV